ncbi:MAG: DUF2141 domain-containing protein [Parasphingorhabdus sp.]|nr:DUF2141 domain-containing protein [Parasphingorhabdus sp.]
MISNTAIARVSVIGLLALSPSTAQAAVYGDVSACAAGSSQPAALIYFDGLKDRKGKVRLELFPDNDNDFLRDDYLLLREGKAFRRIEIDTPASGVVALCLKAPRAGRYSMAIIHDRDGLRKFSFSVDGVGFPGNPKLGWSKPKAAKAFVNLGNGPTTLRVTLKYFSGLGFSPVKQK